MPQRPPAALAQIEIGEPIAETAMFRMVEAYLPGAKRPAMLKVTQEGVLGPAGVAWCLERTAKARAIRHPNLVGLLAAEGEGDALAFVVERVEGRPLDALFAESRPANETAARWVAQLARAVDIVHARGMGHGAIRPNTVTIERGNGAARLVDLATAAVEREAEGLPPAEPEEDLEALSAMLIHLVRPSSKASSLPEPLANLIETLQDPVRRPRSGNALAAAIEDALAALLPASRAEPAKAPQGTGLAETPPVFVPETAPPARDAPSTGTAKPKPPPEAPPPAKPAAASPRKLEAARAAPRRKSPSMLVPLALLALAVLGLGLWALWPGEETRVEEPPIAVVPEATDLAEEPPLVQAPAVQEPEPPAADATAVPASPAPAGAAGLTWEVFLADVRDLPCTRVERGGAVPLPDLFGWTSDAALRTALLADAERLAGVRTAAVALVEEGGGAPVCGLFDLLAAGTAVPETPLIGLLPPRVEPRLQENDPLILRLPGADEPGHLRVDYFMADGRVLHLWPREGDAQAVPTGEEVLIGDPQAGSWLLIAPPFGQELVVALRSAAPLLEPRPEVVEPAEAYLDALGTALAEAEAPPLASTIVIETEPSPADG